MSKDSETNYLKRYKKRNKKKAGWKEVPGENPLEKYKNKNRIDAGRKPKS
ncbi:hypothetical protein [Fodinibius halophilus]|uniref:Uncharacterized protein n=1 Tax=Fodinibius halophilus TaxID=1736908 RepID=A0A6M1TDA7_9BACT|nr:hypothetical protein [Fodinibius halophilus]NGP90011.1 hypothetical protein [Fodinibius halophilus]